MRFLLIGLLVVSAGFASALELKPGTWVATTRKGATLFGGANLEVRANGAFSGTGFFSFGGTNTITGKIGDNDVITIRIDNGTKTKTYRTKDISSDGESFTVTLEDGFRLTANKVVKSMPFAGIYRGNLDSSTSRLIIVVAPSGTATAFVFIFDKLPAPLVGKVTDQTHVAIRRGEITIDAEISKGVAKPNIKGSIDFANIHPIDFTLRYLD